MKSCQTFQSHESFALLNTVGNESMILVLQDGQVIGFCGLPVLTVNLLLKTHQPFFLSDT